MTFLAFSTLPKGVLVALAALFGALVGSFLNVVAYRLPIMMQRQWEDEARDVLGMEPIAREPFDLNRPRSRCPHCGHAIRAWENIPVLSWLVLRGKCSSCKAAISPQYPLGEALAAAVTAAIVWREGASLTTLVHIGLAWSQLAAAWVDAKSMILPDDIVLPMLWAGLLWHTFHDVGAGQSQYILGAAFGYFGLRSLSALFTRFTGREGMGFGDFKLLGALGAWFGLLTLPFVLIISAAFTFAGWVVARLALGHKHPQMPFGPGLAASGLLFLVVGYAPVFHAVMTVL